MVVSKQERASCQAPLQPQNEKEKKWNDAGRSASYTTVAPAANQRRVLEALWRELPISGCGSRGGLWGSAYKPARGGSFKAKSGDESCQLVAGALEALEQAAKRALAARQGGAADQEAALLQAAMRDMMMVADKDQQGPEKTPVAGTPKKEMGETLGVVLFPSWARASGERDDGNVDAKEMVMEC